MAIVNNKSGLVVSVNIETASEFNVSEQVKNRVEKALQQVVNECSTEFYRNIKADIKITLE